MTPLLAVDGVAAGYEASEVLHGVSLEVRAGEIVTIIGPNGAGKSTVMKAIFGLVRPSRGSIRLEGRDVTRLGPAALVRLGLGYVPQVDNVFPSLTVEENLDMGAVILDEDPAPRREAVMALFPALQERRRHKAGARFPGGERQMVAMGRALMLEPRLLLLDEPSAGLAPIMVEAVLQKIQDINRAGVAVLLVEQNARAALALSHRGYVLAGGQTRLEGTGPELLANEEVARLYLGG